MGNWLSAGKRTLWNCDHCTLHVAVDVVDVRDRGRLVDYCCVVNIRNRCCIHCGVGDVHPIYVPWTHAIGGYINFAGSKRKPAYVAVGPSSISNEGDKSGGIDGSHLARPRYPAPPAINRGPASIMKRRVAPWVVIDPSPSPRIDPGPVALVIRRPARCYPGKPDVPIARIRPPVTVVIQIFKPDDIRRAILRRARILIAALTRVAPIVKVIGIPNLLNLGAE